MVIDDRSQGLVADIGLFVTAICVGGWALYGVLWCYARIVTALLSAVGLW